ncbi:hypothetical protein HDE_03144 [Halotydeus destructor]|nr:hypothetical protein HDE_03144 [Halotydeus destructor]
MAEFQALQQDTISTFFGPQQQSSIELNWSWILSNLASVGMIFGGVVPYFPQYREIKRTGNAEGFSTYVCLVLLMANTLRILFWFGKRFETPLLIQSVVMIIAMFAMIELCVRTKYNNNVMAQKQRSFIALSSKNSPKKLKLKSYLSRKQTFTDLNYKSFWKWTDFVSYVECTAAFTVAMGILMYIFMDVPFFVESVGYLSLSTEALLASPQLVKNFKSKSTSGLNKNMVLMWTIGDLFKTAYFIVNQVPAQFWLCGITQVTIDLLILGQVALYKSARYKKVAKDEREVH